MDCHAVIKQAYKDSVNDNKFDKNMQWATSSGLLFARSNEFQIIVGQVGKKGHIYLDLNFG